MREPKNELSIEKLVGANGDWTVSYVYNNYGDNILFLLPTMNNNALADEINDAVRFAPSDIFEVAMLITKFCDEHPGTPFIVHDETISLAAKLMDGRLNAFKDYDEFSEAAEEFCKWAKVVYLVSLPDNVKLGSMKNIDSSYLAVKAYYEGWKAVYDMLDDGTIELPIPVDVYRIKKGDDSDE